MRRDLKIQGMDFTDLTDVDDVNIIDTPGYGVAGPPRVSRYGGGAPPPPPPPPPPPGMPPAPGEWKLFS